MNTVHARIAGIRHAEHLTQKEFADRLEVSQAYISSLEKGKRELSRNVINALREQFRISTDWLLEGKGSMRLGDLLADDFAGGNGHSDSALVSSVPSGILDRLRQMELQLSGRQERVLPITVNAASEPNIVLVPVKAQAGYALGRVQPDYLGELPNFSLPDQRFRNGTFRAFEIAGDSMEPTLFGNDIVVCRSVQDWRWLRDHELYVVVMKEDVLVKRVRNFIRQDMTVELVSDNRFYPPFRVPVEEILEIWQVTARLTSHLPSPGVVAQA